LERVCSRSGSEEVLLLKQTTTQKGTARVVWVSLGQRLRNLEQQEPIDDFVVPSISNIHPSSLPFLESPVEPSSFQVITQKKMLEELEPKGKAL
jgi:hypothetical protein